MAEIIVGNPDELPSVGVGIELTIGRSAVKNAPPDAKGAGDNGDADQSIMAAKQALHKNREIPSGDDEDGAAKDQKSDTEGTEPTDKPKAEPDGQEPPVEKHETKHEAGDGSATAAAAEPAADIRAVTLKQVEPKSKDVVAPEATDEEVEEAPALAQEAPVDGNDEDEVEEGADEDGGLKKAKVVHPNKADDADGKDAAETARQQADEAAREKANAVHPSKADAAANDTGTAAPEAPTPPATEAGQDEAEHRRTDGEQSQARDPVEDAATEAGGVGTDVPDNGESPATPNVDETDRQGHQDEVAEEPAEPVPPVGGGGGGNDDPPTDVLTGTPDPSEGNGDGPDINTGGETDDENAAADKPGEEDNPWAGMKLDPAVEEAAQRFQERQREALAREVGDNQGVEAADAATQPEAVGEEAEGEAEDVEEGVDGDPEPEPEVGPVDESATDAATQPEVFVRNPYGGWDMISNNDTREGNAVQTAGGNVDPATVVDEAELSDEDQAATGSEETNVYGAAQPDREMPDEAEARNLAAQARAANIDGSDEGQISADDPDGARTGQTSGEGVYAATDKVDDANSKSAQADGTIRVLPPDVARDELARMLAEQAAETDPDTAARIEQNYWDRVIGNGDDAADTAEGDSVETDVVDAGANQGLEDDSDEVPDTSAAAKYKQRLRGLDPESAEYKQIQAEAKTEYDRAKAEYDEIGRVTKLANYPTDSIAAQELREKADARFVQMVELDSVVDETRSDTNDAFLQARAQSLAARQERENNAPADEKYLRFSPQQLRTWKTDYERNLARLNSDPEERYESGSALRAAAIEKRIRDIDVTLNKFKQARESRDPARTALRLGKPSVQSILRDGLEHFESGTAAFHRQIGREIAGLPNDAPEVARAEELKAQYDQRRGDGRASGKSRAGGALRDRISAERLMRQARNARLDESDRRIDEAKRVGVPDRRARAMKQLQEGVEGGAEEGGGLATATRGIRRGNAPGKAKGARNFGERRPGGATPKSRLTETGESRAAAKAIATAAKREEKETHKKAILQLKAARAEANALEAEITEKVSNIVGAIPILRYLNPKANKLVQRYKGARARTKLAKYEAYPGSDPLSRLRRAIG